MCQHRFPDAPALVCGRDEEHADFVQVEPAQPRCSFLGFAYSEVKEVASLPHALRRLRLQERQPLRLW
jgi:hypothetical protein